MPVPLTTVCATHRKSRKVGAILSVNMRHNPSRNLCRNKLCSGTICDMKIGYARVSTDDQNLDLQRDALAVVKCDSIYEEKASGKNADRPELVQCLKALRTGDTLIVWRLDRLGRSLPDLVKIVADLEARGIGFESLQEKIDTGSAGGKLVFHVFAALAEFERNLIRERTKAGLAAARARGRKGGRKPKLDEKQLAAAKVLLADPDTRVCDVADMLGVSRSTLYRSIGVVVPRRHNEGEADA